MTSLWKALIDSVIITSKSNCCMLPFSLPLLHYYHKACSKVMVLMIIDDQDDVADTNEWIREDLDDHALYDWVQRQLHVGVDWFVSSSSTCHRFDMIGYITSSFPWRDCIINCCFVRKHLWHENDGGIHLTGSGYNTTVGELPIVLVWATINNKIYYNIMAHKLLFHTNMSYLNPELT